MNASLQSQIAPPVAPGAVDVNAAQVKAPSEAVDANSTKKKADFRDLLTNSNEDVKKEREAKKNNDLSGAKSEGEFLQKLADQTAEKPRVPKNSLDKDDFLKLFVTQLQNQNPLSPDDSAEMASKLAQFNSLEQMLNVNKTLEKMLAGQTADKSMQLINYVGKDVTVKGGRVKLQDGDVTDATFSLGGNATQATMEIRDSAGVIVSQKELGTLEQGEHKFEWNGKAPDGRTIPNGVYTFSITAKNVDNQSIPATVVSKVKIQGVDIQDKAGAVFTDFGRVKLEDIVAVGSPGYTEAPILKGKGKGAKGAVAGAVGPNGEIAPAGPAAEALKAMGAQAAAGGEGADAGGSPLTPEQKQQLIQQLQQMQMAKQQPNAEPVKAAEAPKPQADASADAKPTVPVKPAAPSAPAASASSGKTAAKPKAIDTKA